MQTSAISTAAAAAISGQSLAPAGATDTDKAPFAGLFKSAVGNVQNLQDQAANAVQGLITGQGVDVHQAMIATQKADMSFEMALAVRSKAVAAYQQIMQMQF